MIFQFAVIVYGDCIVTLVCRCSVEWTLHMRIWQRTMRPNGLSVTVWSLGKIYCCTYHSTSQHYGDQKENRNQFKTWNI